MTKREELLALHDTLCSEAKALMVRKNQDYAKSEDPLKNFRKRGLLGMLVRLEDKMARLDTFVETGILAVSEEPVDDLFKDIINYAILMQYCIAEARGQARELEELEVNQRKLEEQQRHYEAWAKAALDAQLEATSSEFNVDDFIASSK